MGEYATKDSGDSRALRKEVNRRFELLEKEIELLKRTRHDQDPIRFTIRSPAAIVVPYFPKVEAHAEFDSKITIIRFSHVGPAQGSFYIDDVLKWTITIPGGSKTGRLNLHGAQIFEDQAMRCSLDVYPGGPPDAVFLWFLRPKSKR
jgi:hypothetical protein